MKKIECGGICIFAVFLAVWLTYIAGDVFAQDEKGNWWKSAPKDEVRQHNRWEICPTEYGERPEGDGWTEWKIVTEEEPGQSGNEHLNYVNPKAGKAYPEIIGSIWRRKIRQTPRRESYMISIDSARNILSSFNEAHPEGDSRIPKGLLDQANRIVFDDNIMSGSQVDISKYKNRMGRYLEKFGYTWDDLEKWMDGQIPWPIPEVPPFGLALLFPALGGGLAWLRSRFIK